MVSCPWFLNKSLVAYEHFDKTSRFFEWWIIFNSSCLPPRYGKATPIWFSQDNGSIADWKVFIGYWHKTLSGCKMSSDIRKIADPDPDEMPSKEREIQSNSDRIVLGVGIGINHQIFVRWVAVADHCSTAHFFGSDMDVKSLYYTCSTQYILYMCEL